MAVDGNGPGESGPTHPGDGAEGVGEGPAVGTAGARAGDPPPAGLGRRRPHAGAPDHGPVPRHPRAGRVAGPRRDRGPGEHRLTAAGHRAAGPGPAGDQRAGDPPAHQDSVPATAGGGAHRLLRRPHRRPGHQAGRLPVPDQAGEHRRAAGDRAAGPGARRSAGGDREPAPQGGPRRGAGVAAGRQRGHADRRPPHPPGGRRPTSPC